MFETLAKCLTYVHVQHVFCNGQFSNLLLVQLKAVSKPEGWQPTPSSPFDTRVKVCPKTIV